MQSSGARRSGQELFRQAEVRIGRGTAEYPMTRGSFIYKEKLQRKADLQLGEIRETETGFSRTMTDPKTGKKGQMVCSSEPDGMTRLHLDLREMDGNRIWITLPARPEEHVYGAGETFPEFDLKGQMVRIWVAEHQNSKRISKKIIKEKLRGPRPEKKLPFLKYESYYCQPTVVFDNRTWLHAETNGFMAFDFRKKDRTVLYFRTEDFSKGAENGNGTESAVGSGPLSCDLLFGSADSFEELSARQAGRFGHLPKLPEWIYSGTILASQTGTEAAEKALAAADAAGIPVCGIWSQDWCGCRRTGFGYQVMWNWKWDQEMYPELPEKIREWKTRGVRFLGYINPFISIDRDLYQTAHAKGYCVKNKAGEDYLVTITTFPASMIDFTNPEAYAWYKNLIKENMIGIGLGGWMADFGEYLPPDAVLFDGSDAAERHNEWPAIWARMNREAIEECGVQGDVFFFTRAGYTETIRYSTMMWNGDQHVDWSVDDGIGSVIPGSLSLAMSGFPVVHSDVGGYTTIMHMTRSKELLQRWEEMNAFSPLMRFHQGNQPVKNVQFDTDQDLLSSLSKWSRMHVALKPYLLQAEKEADENGTPVMRPLFYHYDEPFAYTETTEYLLGRDILAAPVLKKGAVSRTVRLPKDTWVHLFTGKEYSGGSFEVEAPIGLPPVFIRKSSVFRESLREAAEKL